MNKASASVIGLLTLMSVSSFAMAAYTGPQEQNKVSVAQLKDLADDSWATLEGKLVKHLGGEKTIYSAMPVARLRSKWIRMCGAAPKWVRTT